MERIQKQTHTGEDSYLSAAWPRWSQGKDSLQSSLHMCPALEQLQQKHIK